MINCNLDFSSHSIPTAHFTTYLRLVLDFRIFALLNLCLTIVFSLLEVISFMYPTKGKNIDKADGHNTTVGHVASVKGTLGKSKGADALDGMHQRVRAASRLSNTRAKK